MTVEYRVIQIMLHLITWIYISSSSAIDLCGVMPNNQISNTLFKEWVSEWLCLTAFLRTADIEVHEVYISRVIIAYKLESLPSLT